MPPSYVRVLVFCNYCRHQRDADLQALVDQGRGDVPLVHLRLRCSQYGTVRRRSPAWVPAIHPSRAPSRMPGRRVCLFDVIMRYQP